MKKPFVNIDGIPSEIHLGNDNNTSEVLVGTNQSITISKEYGPACFSNIRVTPIVDKDWSWKIEMMNNATGAYEEMLSMRHEICYDPPSDS